MNNLPTEILRQIFILLFQDDQLECMLTCHHWKNTIEKYCLFRTLHVHSYSLLKQVLKKIQEQPRLGNNVQQFTAFFNEQRWFDLANFLLKLPNIRKLCIYLPSFEVPIIINQLEFPWRNHIESIKEGSNGTIFHSVFSKNTFPNLTDLHISEDINDIIPLLKSAPALKTLTLKGGVIEIDSINEIHEHLPNLKMLSFKNTTFYQDSTEREITPAKSITGLFLLDAHVSSLELELRFLQFITKKYPNLVDLGYETCFNSSSRHEDNTLYNDGWNLLFESLGPQLKTLYTKFTNIYQNFLPTLDKYSCQIQNMKIHCLHEPFPNFAQSEQVLYIQTLVLRDIKLNSLEWLNNLKVLEALEIYNGHLLLDLNELLESSSSTLKSLTIYNTSLTADVVSAKQHGVKNLLFIRCNLPKKLVWFIDRHFPLLTNLKIQNCNHLPKNIKLISTELESFCFIDSNRGSPIYVFVRTIYDCEERFYFTRDMCHYSPFAFVDNKFNDSDIPPVKSQPADNMNVKPDMTLCCFTVKKVILCR